jgi:hypothetical protein
MQLLIGHGRRLEPPSAHRAAKAELIHQPLDGAARHDDLFTITLPIGN